MASNNQTSRLRFVSICLILVAFVLVAKLYMLQIVDGADYRDRAERQYINPAQTVFDRGSIFFSNKDGNLISAATLKSGFTIAINPKVIDHPEDIYNRVSSVLPIDEKTFMSKANKKTDPYEEIANRVDEEIVNKLKTPAVTGLGFYKERWRYYPGGSLASNTLGLLGYKDDIFAGRYGIERFYENTLTRESQSTYKNFFAEIFLGIEKSLSDSAALEGDVITTIEPSVQNILETELKATKSKWHSKQVGGIILNPTNGEIYAMAVNPDFDPNNFKNEEDVSIFGNPLVESVFEMGSIIKPLTIAAGLDAGAVTASTTYDDKGFITLDGKKISNYDGKARGVVSMQEVLNQSLNLGVSFVATKLGKEKFSTYMRNFGLGEKTGIDLPGEVNGLIKNLDSKRDVEHATASFGQGIATTPIETVRALSSIINGGYLITPHVGKEIKYKIGTFKTLSFPVGQQVVSKAASDEITRMLVTVVDKALAGGTVKLNRYSVGAKTGTAQIANPAGGGYYADKYLHSFFGFFPAYKPRFMIFLYNLEPKDVQYASQTLTDPFMDLTKYLINYYQVPPDR